MVMAAVLAATGLVRRSRRAAMLAVVVALAALAGAIGLVVAVSIVVLVAAVRRLRHARETSPGGDAETLLSVAAVGVAAGAPFSSAMRRATAGLSDGRAAEVRRALRSFDQGTPTLVGDPVVRAVFEAASISASTGTPLAPRLELLAEHHRADATAALRASQARLPVKLLFPLAFLILPGFVLLVVVPAMAGGLGSLAL